MFISKFSDILEKVEQSPFNYPIVIRHYGFHFRSTDLADNPNHRIMGQFVNKSGQRLFYDRTLLISFGHPILSNK